ncbi:MAG: thioesterase family protein [Hyphomonas sp.]|nr:thioesterase family protein [Hyphomonas sp.]
MSAVVRRNGWIPIVVSSVQTRRQPAIPAGELEIHTRVVGWEDQYVEIEHTWFDAMGAEVLNSVYLTRVTHAGRDKVTGADMLRELGEAYVEAPLSPTARGLLDEYLRVKDANQALSLA